MFMQKLVKKGLEVSPTITSGNTRNSLDITIETDTGQL